MEDTDRLIAQAQIGLSYIIFIGYLAIWVLTGLEYLKPVNDGALKEILLLIAFFWFQRTRAGQTPPPADPAKTT